MEWEDDDDALDCFGAPSKEKLLALMLEMGFVKTGEDTYTLLGMDYLVGHTDDDDGEKIWLAAPADELTEIDPKENNDE